MSKTHRCRELMAGYRVGNDGESLWSTFSEEAVMNVLRLMGRVL